MACCCCCCFSLVTFFFHPLRVIESDRQQRLCGALGIGFVLLLTLFFFTTLWLKHIHQHIFTNTKRFSQSNSSLHCSPHTQIVVLISWKYHIITFLHSLHFLCLRFCSLSPPRSFHVWLHSLINITGDGSVAVCKKAMAKNAHSTLSTAFCCLFSADTAYFILMFM